ncbi:MAG TPA: hypothetical protein VK045_11785 [Ornithinicoccus sp.]|jgi:hypothetical protein|nr:hypothetical protein [Ornithinicoccus sp.]
MKKTEKTPGPSGKTLELREIPRRTVGVVHEHRAHATPRYEKLGGVANRRARRAYARARRTTMPAPTLEPYEKAVHGATARDLVSVF